MSHSASLPQSQPCIQHIHAREILDSRGKPTVEVEVLCDDGSHGTALVPSGASTGTFEACELRDGDPRRLFGQGVLRAVSHVNVEIARALLGEPVHDQTRIDRLLCDLDGTPHKGRLGANAILGTSLAVADAAAHAARLPRVLYLHELWRQVPHGPHHTLSDETIADREHPHPGDHLSIPLPMVNMISGGLHAGGNLDFQDFLILPVGAGSYRQALTWIVTVYHTLGRLLKEGGFEGTLVGDEGGYGPRLAHNEQAVQCLVRAIEQAGFRPGEEIAIGLDVASSHFRTEDGYTFITGHTPDSRPETLTSSQMVDLLVEWVNKYPIVSIEDGVAEDDWNGWRELTSRIGDRVQLIGDDLFVTQVARLQRGIDEHVANSVLVKVNQVGTLTETLETLRLALDHRYAPVISARSGETEDCFIADLAVATGAGQIKIGSVARSERLAKYNQLLRLEERLADRARFAGNAILRRGT